MFVVVFNLLNHEMFSWWSLVNSVASFGWHGWVFDWEYGLGTVRYGIWCWFLPPRLSRVAGLYSCQLCFRLLVVAIYEDESDVILHVGSSLWPIQAYLFPTFFARFVCISSFMAPLEPRPTKIRVTHSLPWLLQALLLVRPKYLNHLVWYLADQVWVCGLSQSTLHLRLGSVDGGNEWDGWDRWDGWDGWIWWTIFEWLAGLRYVLRPKEKSFNSITAISTRWCKTAGSSFNPGSFFSKNISFFISIIVHSNDHHNHHNIHVGPKDTRVNVF